MNEPSQCLQVNVLPPHRIRTPADMASIKILSLMSLIFHAGSVLGPIDSKKGVSSNPYSKAWLTRGLPSTPTFI